MLKKIKYFIIASCMIIPLSSTLTHVSATSTEVVQPRAALCSCGGVFRPSGTEYSAWRYTGDTRRGTHQVYGLNHEQKRTVTQYQTCERCSASYDTTKTEYRCECRGYDNP